MEYHDISVYRDGGVVEVTLSRPKAMNALSMRLRDELEDFLGGVGNDPSVDLVLITGGPDLFSAGFDLKEAVQTHLGSFRHRILEFHEAIYKTKKFVVTAVSGIALAGGFDLALAGDLIWASPSASFGHVEVNFRINPLVFPLIRKVGIARAVELCATGRFVSADEARSLGIVNEILPLEDFTASARKRAAQIARMGARTLSGIKEASISALPCDITESLKSEFSITEKLLAEDELYDRLVAYLTSIGLMK
jgi:enoyl-CoA hydratase/carnithine racemase